MEQVLEFFCEGFKLYGVLHTPTTRPQRRVVVVLVPYGMNTRHGPQRVYVNLARELCQAGYYCWRFDSIGCGDSEGDLSNLSGHHRDSAYWQMVNNGGFINDVCAAVQHIKATIAPDGILLGGICGGAIRAALVAAEDHAIKGAMLCGFPSTIADPSATSLDKMTERTAHLTLKAYLAKLTRLESWLRLLSFRSEYGRIYKSLIKGMTGKFFRSKPATANTAGSLSLSVDKQPVNERLVQAMFTIARSDRKFIVAFGENDPYLHMFEEKMEPRLWAEAAGTAFEKDIVPMSNHEFGLAEWQARFRSGLFQWISKHFSVHY